MTWFCKEGMLVSSQNSEAGLRAVLVQICVYLLINGNKTTAVRWKIPAIGRFQGQFTSKTTVTRRWPCTEYRWLSASGYKSTMQSWMKRITTKISYYRVCRFVIGMNGNRFVMQWKLFQSLSINNVFTQTNVITTLYKYLLLIFSMEPYCFLIGVSNVRPWLTKFITCSSCTSIWWKFLQTHFCWYISWDCTNTCISGLAIIQHDVQQKVSKRQDLTEHWFRKRQHDGQFQTSFLTVILPLLYYVTCTVYQPDNSFPFLQYSYDYWFKSLRIDNPLEWNHSFCWHNW